MSQDILIISHPRGATFFLSGLVGLPAPTGVWSGRSQVRKIAADGSVGDLLEDLTVTLTPPVAPATKHAIVIEGSSVIAPSWPLEKLRMDLRLADESDPPMVIYSPRFVINVQPTETDSGS